MFANVVLPPDYYAIKDFPGYFFNRMNNAVYSMKVTGELKPLAKICNRWGGIQTRFFDPLGAYRFSKEGKPYTRTVTWIKKNLHAYHIVEESQRYRPALKVEADDRIALS